MKKFVGHALLGALIGIAIQYILAIIISLKLHLGYLMAYIATLAESVHGEMNAILLEVALSALAGMGIAVALTFARQKQWALHKRRMAAGLSLITGCMPAMIITLYLVYGLV